MQIFDNGKIYNFMGKKNVFFILSGILIALSIFSLFTKGLNYGIDFSGGTLVQIRYDQVAPISQIRSILDKQMQNVSVTEFGSKEEIVIRYASANENLSQDPGMAIAKLLENTGKFEIRRVDVVGPKVGAELREKGIMAISISLVLILLYIALRFEWRFAVSAILTEVHDVLITLGVISFLQLDVNLDTLAAVLTIIGYSLNDTIIIFDRIREGVQTNNNPNLDSNINESVSATLSRTFMTSLTTLLTVLTLFFFGGDIIHGFSIIMLSGIIIGTFSSVFVASAMLIWFKFDVTKYRANLAQKERKRIEKEKIRAMYEKGTI